MNPHEKKLKELIRIKIIALKMIRKGTLGGTGKYMFIRQLDDEIAKTEIKIRLH